LVLRTRPAKDEIWPQETMLRWKTRCTQKLTPPRALAARDRKSKDDKHQDTENSISRKIKRGRISTTHEI
jgi:hypothetical protein